MVAEVHSPLATVPELDSATGEGTTMEAQNDLFLAYQEWRDHINEESIATHGLDGEGRLELGEGVGVGRLVIVFEF